MNTCIISTFNCTFEVFKEKVESDRLCGDNIKKNWSIAKVDEHKSIMVMNMLDFEALEAFMTSVDMKEWDKENACVDTLYSMNVM